jgi:hypothetical protein
MRIDERESPIKKKTDWIIKESKIPVKPIKWQVIASQLELIGVDLEEGDSKFVRTISTRCYTQNSLQ